MSVSASSISAAAVRLVEPVNPAELHAGTPILAASYQTPLEFLDSFAAERGDAGELAVRTRAAPPTGTPMVVEIAFPGLPNRVFVRAHALRRWLGGHLVLAFDTDECDKRDFLLRAARGEVNDVFLRLHRRFCVRLPLTWRRFGDTRSHDGVAEDVSSGGLLIVAQLHEEIPAIGERVAVRLRADAAYQDMVLTAEVRHAHTRRDRRIAFGVSLQYRSSAQQRSLRALLRAFAGRGVVLVDPSCE